MNLPLAAFDVRPDERGSFALASEEFDADITLNSAPLTPDTLRLLDGDVKGVSILGVSHVDRDMMTRLAERGVTFVATRSIGFDNVDIAAAQELGIRVANASYAPEGVAEFTVMLMLAALRKLKHISARVQVQDYSLQGAGGRELGRQVVGIIGTGRIGATVARIVKNGFGSDVIAYDVYRNPALDGIVRYVELDELLGRADLITLHAPLSATNSHMLDAAAFAKMKDGVAIVNCSRGELIDTMALIDAIESRKVGAVAADVIEHDLEYFHQDLRLDVIRNRQLAILRSFSNVMLTPHVAFYTDRAVHDMVFASIGALTSFVRTGESTQEVTARQ